MNDVLVMLSLLGSYDDELSCIELNEKIVYIYRYIYIYVIFCDPPKNVSYCVVLCVNMCLFVCICV